jgi:hypothetical protein
VAKVLSRQAVAHPQFKRRGHSENPKTQCCKITTSSFARIKAGETAQPFIIHFGENKMIRQNDVIDLIELQLGDFTCLRWFDPAGVLNVSGPKEATAELSAYINKYAPICRHESLDSFLQKIPPFGKRNLHKKKHAMLTILLEHKKDVENGMGVSAELVKAVLGTFEPLWSIRPLD